MSDPSPCQACGACCAHDPSWPRFSLEAEEDLAIIPDALVAADKSGMAWKLVGSEGRCAALTGDIGKAVACSIYGLRPDVCRACQPGDPECNIARAGRGFPPL